jgi:spermidine synthase
MHIEVVDRPEEAGIIRYLLVDGKEESVSYIDNRRNELIYPYWLLVANEMEKINAQSVLLFGGGGFSLPKYYFSRFQNGEMDVVEINSQIVEIAKRHFFVNELIHDFNLDENKRMTIVIADGRDYIKSSSKMYDMVINDAYNAGEMAENILEISCVEQIAAHLVVGGLYIINMFTALEGPKKAIWEKEKIILDQFFIKSTIIQVNNEFPKSTRQNCLVIATK